MTNGKRGNMLIFLNTEWKTSTDFPIMNKCVSINKRTFSVAGCSFFSSFSDTQISSYLIIRLMNGNYHFITNTSLNSFMWCWKGYFEETI